MSSRNERLSQYARIKAATIYEILQQAKTNFATHTLSETKAFVRAEFEKHPEFELEYFEIANEETLLSATCKDAPQKYRGFIAVFIDKIRLIDNISLN
jgi:pantoate--beta-alanine ligase